MRAVILLHNHAVSLTPKRLAAFLRSPGRVLLWRLLLVCGVGMQWLLVWVCFELVELCISLMEVWADLARKHLEITL